MSNKEYKYQENGKEIILKVSLIDTKIKFDLHLENHIYGFKYEIDYNCIDSAFHVFHHRSNKENCKKLVDHVLLAATVLTREKKLITPLGEN